MYVRVLVIFGQVNAQRDTVGAEYICSMKINIKCLVFVITHARITELPKLEAENSESEKKRKDFFSAVKHH